MDLNLEKSCIVAFQNFVDILRPTSTKLNDAIIELNGIVVRIENLSPKLTALANIEENEEEDLVLYPIEMVKKILSLILSELNDNVNRAHELIRQIGKSIDDLHKSNLEFMAAGSAVRVLEECSIVRGAHNRKPLDYYIEESCTLLHAWRELQRGVDAVWRNVNVRDLKTLEIVKRTQHMPLKCQELMEEYLLYCSQLATNKRSK